MDDIVKLLTSIVWPVIALYVLAKFKDSISDFIAIHSSSVLVKIPGGGEISLRAEEASQLVQEILSELDSLIEDISERRKGAICKHLVLFW